MSGMETSGQADPPAPVRPAGPRGEGSLVVGVALAWIISVVGGLVVLGLVGLVVPRSGTAIFAVGWLPFLISVGLAAWMIVKGPRRTGIGILVGIGSMWAVGLLLVAACFGIFFLGNWH